MWTRRESIAGGALTLIFGGGSCGQAANSRAPNSAGCRLADADFDSVYPSGTETRAFISGEEPIIPGSGDRDFDRALARTLAYLSDALGVLPAFGYFDDVDEWQANAYATKRSRMNRVDGTVLMGLNLMQKLRRRYDSSDVAIATVCAHEFAHILQFRHNLFDRLDAGRPNVKRSELQADYLAGYFTGLRKRMRPAYPAAVAATAIYDLGDNSTGRDHHGTTQERGAAVVRGFEASFRDNKNLNDVLRESTTYALSL